MATSEPSPLAVEREHRVSPLELFFDLVFVFAFTEVTTLWLEQQTWGGLGRGLLVLVALWWVWASFAWLTNAADADAGVVTVVVLGSTAPLFVAALAVPEAFGAHRLAFGISFFAVVAAFVALFVLVSKERADQLAAVLRLAPIVLAGGGLVVVAAFVPSSWRPLLWALALAVGFVGPQARGVAGWQVEPSHFAERHGLIVIIAIGESLGAIGFGARNSGLGAGVLVAAVLGLVVAASFWLGYFDFASRSLQSRLASRRGPDRVALARDAYTYAHLPMVVGIILFAFGMRATLAHVHAHLHLIPALALCCGSAVYLLGFVALRWRVSRTLGGGRPTAAVVFAALTAVATSVPALAAVALVATVWLGLHAYELIRWREERARQRAATLDAAVAPE
jgi:low temperature requirement protein LtrA